MNRIHILAAAVLLATACNSDMRTDNRIYNQPRRNASGSGNRSNPQAENTPQSPQRHPDAPRNTAPTPETTPDGQDIFPRLTLVSGADAANSNDRSEIQLRNTGARSMARLIEMLYTPTGIGGTDVRSFLIYQDKREIAAARELIPLFDTPALPRTTPTSQSSEAAFRMGVDMLSELAGTIALPSDRLIRDCQDALEWARRSANSRIRFAAAMLIGRLHADIRLDARTARPFFAAARSEVAEDSLEALNADWAAAECLSVLENEPEFLAECRTLCGHYADLTQTSAYQRAATACGQIDSPTPGN